MAKQNTLGTFVRMYNKVAACSDIDSLTFEQMNVSWMKDFDAFLSGKIKIFLRIPGGYIFVISEQFLMTLSIEI